MLLIDIQRQQTLALLQKKIAAPVSSLAHSLSGSAARPRLAAANLAPSLPPSPAKSVACSLLGHQIRRRPRPAATEPRSCRRCALPAASSRAHPRLRHAPPTARSTSRRRAPRCSARAREAAPVAADGNGWRGVCDGGCGIAMAISGDILYPLPHCCCCFLCVS
jgi:hypothetical protein